MGLTQEDCCGAESYAYQTHMNFNISLIDNGYVFGRDGKRLYAKDKAGLLKEFKEVISKLK